MPVEDSCRVFPWEEATPRDREEPNDIPSDLGQDVTCTNHHLYFYDYPSSLLESGSVAFEMYRATFKTWVRIQPPGSGGFLHKEYLVEGSRASDVYDWHSVFYLKRGDDGNFEEDLSSPSFSAPVFIGAPEAGMILVFPVSTASTDGYTAKYTAATGTWTLTQASDNDTSSDSEVPGDGTYWCVGFTGKVTVYILQIGAGAYVDNARYKFSIFGSANKASETKTGFYTVTPDP